jgi:hypothetical protein
LSTGSTSATGEQKEDKHKAQINLEQKKNKGEKSNLKKQPTDFPPFF